MGGSEEGSGIFGVASGNPAPALKVEEGIFDQTPCFVEMFVIIAFLFAIFSGWNLGAHALLCGLFNDRITVIALIRY